MLENSCCAIKWDIVQTQPIRVLCLEDNELVADAIARKLEGDDRFQWLGWVNNESSLFATIAELQPDVVCMDLMLASHTTEELIKRLRNGHPGSRVLVISRTTRESDVTRAMNAGAYGFISKGEESRFIIDAIQRVGRGQQVFGRITLDSCTQKPSRPD